MMIITISEKGGQQSQYDFSSAAVTIGRMKGNDIVLPKGNVSKKHSRITSVDGQLFITDMNSTNGTYVNGRKVTGEQAIAESDKIYIGDFILQVQSAPAAHPPAPPQRSSGSGSMRPPAPPAAPELGHSGGGAGSVDELFADAIAQPGRDRRPKNTIRESNLRFDDPAVSAEAAEGRAPSRQDSLTPAAQPVAGREGAAEQLLPSADLMPADPSGPLRDGAPAGRLGGDTGDRARRRALPVARKIRDEFDSEFHSAQYDVARVLLDTVSTQDFPLDYPPSADAHKEFEKHVSRAIDVASPSVDQDSLQELIINECVGLGPIDQYLDDPQVQDIYIQRFDRILVRRAGELSVAERGFSHPEFLVLAAHRLLGSREPALFADEVRFGDGSRAHVVMPPVAVDGPAITIRKPPVEHPTLDELVASNVLSAGMGEFLERMVQAGRSVLIAGPNSSGKTTLLEALGKLIEPGARVITVEDSAQLALDNPSVVRLEADPRAGYDLRALVQTAGAMHPQRILLDECRGGEAYDWISSAAGGTEGSMMTIQGINAAAALEHLESLCLLGKPEGSPRGLREQIARAVDFVVVLNRSDDHGFRVRQICELQGIDLDAFRLNDVFYHRIEGSEEQFHPTGFIPLFYEDLRHSGFDVDFDIFRE